MNGKEIELEWRKLAAQHASPIGLVIILYDILTSDLRKAIESIRSGAIEARCKQLNHAFLVLGQLESSFDVENGGSAARSLSRFYSHIRAKVLEAQLRGNAEILERQIQLILEVREAWKELEHREYSGTPGANSATLCQTAQNHSGPIAGELPNGSASWTSHCDPCQEKIALSWSA